MKRILIIDNSQSVTGALNSILGFANGLKDEFEFHFAIPDGSQAKERIATDGFKVMEVEFLEISRRLKTLNYPFRLRRNTSILEDYIEENSINLIHVNDMYNMIGTRLKKKLNLPLIHHVRLLKDSYIKPLYSTFATRIIKHADAIVCVSEKACKDFPESDVKQVIYNPLGIEEQLAGYQVKEGETFRILSLGKLMPGKGQDGMIEAFYKVFNANRKARLTLIGGDPGKSDYGKQLLKMVDHYNLNSVVEFKDFTLELEQAYKSCDLLVNFSHSESFSRICLEAQYFGVPVISSDCGGPGEIIDSRKSGLLVPNKDVPALADAVIRVMNDKTLRESFSKNARLFVRKKFSDQNTVEALRALYKKLLMS